MGPAPRRLVARIPVARVMATAAMVTVAALLAGCTVGPSQRPPVAVRGDTMVARPGPPPATPAPAQTLPEPQPQRPTLRFVDCTDETISTLLTPPPPDRTLRADCGELTVAADPDEPGLGTATLGVLRVGLVDAPPDRPPLLALGDSAGEGSARHAAVLAGQVAPALLQRYTLVGLDRRGSGTDRLDCAAPNERSALVDGAADPTELLEQARAVVQECTIALDGGIGTFRTTATAADVEQLRDALGVEQLSAVGVGDGAAALAGWARTTPSAVGRLVLDGPPQPGLDEPELTESRAGAAEAAFTAFGLACAARPDCPLGADPRAAVTELVDALRARPLAAIDGRRLTAGAAASAVLAGLGEPRGWPALATAVAAARDRDPAGLLGLLDPVTGLRGRFDAMVATACNDTRRRLSPGEIGELAARWRTTYPLFGATLAGRLLACVPWPTGGAGPSAGAADGAPPILVLGTAADPRGPQDGSRRAAESLRSARFLSWQGAGTGAYPRTPCVTRVVDALLVGGVVPPSGTLCPP